MNSSVSGMQAVKEMTGALRSGNDGPSGRLAGVALRRQACAACFRTVVSGDRGLALAAPQQ